MQNYTPDVNAVLGMLNLLDWMPGFPTDETRRTLIAAAVSSFVDDRQQHHDDLGDVVPLDWLAVEIAKRKIYFPKPIEMRAIYETRFPPLDGKGTVELEGEVAE